MTELTAWADWAEKHAVTLVVVGVLGLAALGGVAMIVRRVRRAGRAEDALTYLAALIATAVAATGMWNFFDKELHELPVPLRVGMFAFIEVAVFTSAVRARGNMRRSAQRVRDEHRTWEKPSAGVDHKAVWALTCLSAVLSTIEADSPGEAVIRLAAPLVAAWLWERGMAIERDSITKRSSTIAWKVTPERLLIKLGLADPTTRDASEVAVHRYVTRLALAANRLRELQETDARGWRQRVARRRLSRARDAAVEYARLGTDPAVLDMLMEQLRVMYNTPAMAGLTLTAPWDLADAVEGVEVEVHRVTPPDPQPDPELPPQPPSGGHPADPAPAPLSPPPVVTPLVTPAPVPNGHYAPEPVGQSVGDDPNGSGHDPVGDPATLLAEASSGAAKVRTAVNLLGVDLQTQSQPEVIKAVTTVLGEHGHDLHPDLVKSAVRRELARLANQAPVIPLDRTTQQGRSGGHRRSP